MRFLPVLGVLPLLLGGCITGDDSGAPGVDSGFTLPEAGGVDASVPDSTLPDAPAADTSADTYVPPPDAPVDTAPQPVRVTVTDGTAPVSGITIVFQDSTGSVITSAVTDATGTVAQLVSSGSLVTALLGAPGAPELFTIVGVEPGDVLTAIDSPPAPTGNQGIEVTTLPASPPAGTTSYTLTAGTCSAGTALGPWSIYVYPNCQAGGTFPLLAVAYDQTSNPLGFAYQKGNVVPDGGLPDGGFDPFVIGGSWSTTFGTEALTIANPPAAVSQVVALTESAGGVLTPTTNGTVVASPDGGASSYLFTVHPGYADFVQGEANVNMGDLTDASVSGYPISIGAVAARGAAPTAEAGVPFDLSQLLPLVTSATLDSTNVARPTTTWASAGSLAAADGQIVLLQWSSFDPDAGLSVTGTWTILAPPTATSVQAPALPSTASAWTPAASASFNAPQVVAVEGSYWSGYAQLRATAANLASSSLLSHGYVGQPVVPALPADGTIKMSAFTFNGD